MPKICYVRKRFSAESRAIIAKANEIIAEYVELGFDLTLRQLYYQMVSRDIIQNKEREYKRLGSIISDARLAGRIDWDRINDLTRELRSVAHWNEPSSIISACASSFRIDKWEGQKYRPEVWVEKDALRNVVERACTPLDVPYFSCRGYVSQSEMWGAAQRLLRYQRAGQTPIIFHLGDHDPSGVDMTRDIRDRLEIFGLDLEVDRRALNMDQIEEYGPPPNPAKTTDTRYAAYIRSFGEESWELDALNPTILSGIIEEAVEGVRDENKWNARVKTEDTHRKLLGLASERWESLVKVLNKPKKPRKKS